jgi:hypothetical protein
MAKPINIAALVTSASARDTLFEVIYGGTLESASFTNNSGIVAWDVAATHVTGGIKLASIYAASDTRANANIFDQQYWLGEANSAGVSEIITVTGRTIGAAGNAVASIDYREFI